MWKAWVGFNASHGMGAILFGLLYAYFALQRAEMLFASPFLLITGLAMLAGYTLLGKFYWFSIPFVGLCAALVLYVASIAFSVASR
jgi:hypothetical protein